MNFSVGNFMSGLRLGSRTGLGKGQNRHEFVTMSPVIALMLDCRFYKYNYACSNKINK